MEDQTITENTCEKLLSEADAATSHSLKIAAGIYEDVAKCFDGEGDRLKAAQYLTIAGDFFLEINKLDKAAACYGKAIVRHLMLDDIDTAKILVNKGIEYGFTEATYQYKMALNALERKTSSLPDEPEKEQDKEIKASGSEEILPEITIVPLDEEEELIPFETGKITDDLMVDLKRQDFIVTELENEDPSKLSSFAVMAAVSKQSRQQKEKIIVSDGVVKDKKGELRVIAPKLSIRPKKDSTKETRSQISPISDYRIEDPSKEHESKPSSDERYSRGEDLDSFLEIKIQDPDTIDFDYSAKSEYANEYEEELLDIEIIDTIPYQWQVVNIQANIELDEEKETEEGRVFTWKAEKLIPGEKAAIEYILRKRVERSIILRKENRVSVLNTYYSLHQNFEIHLNFVNTSGQLFEEILVEDVIPPELIVTSVNSPQKINPVSIPTHDSTLYRWIFSNLPPGDNFEVDYTFKEKPLTRHYQNEINIEDVNISIEKVSQPFIDSFDYEYIWIYIVENPTDQDITLIDRIPFDFEIILVEPVYRHPTVNKEKTNTLLTWNLDSKEKRTMIIMRIKGKESFTPLSPTFEISGVKEVQLLETTSESNQTLIDIRRLKEKYMDD